MPAWRQAQVGALSGLLAHWAVHGSVPALLSLPTGAGKSAIATAVPYLAAAKRVLVLVPSAQLRVQLAEGYRSQEILHEIGAIEHSSSPRVEEIAGHEVDWTELTGADVVVAIPQSLDMVYKTNPPAADFFDLIVVDEAHHAPAPTWKRLLDFHSDARRVLLTATPKRRDGKRVPGEIAFHYPLGHAIAEGVYQPVEPVLIELADGASRADYDAAIADHVISTLSLNEHSTSTLLVRAASKIRAQELADLYRAKGQSIEILTSTTRPTRQLQILAGLRDRTIRAVVVVGMLGEGFDLPSLRVAAYHDKHRSMEPTIQLIGRLVRANRDFPQPSILVAARDIDVFPELQGAVRRLYDEDADWGRLLPQIIDEEIEETIKDRVFASALTQPPAELSVDALRAPVRATVFEVRADPWVPDLAACTRDALKPGTQIRGAHEVFYASVTPDDRTLILVTTRKESPTWHDHTGLDSVRFDLHLYTWLPKPAETEGRNALWLTNSDVSDVSKFVLATLDADSADMRAARPERLQDAFDALPRVSVSNVGVRNTYAGSRGTPSYRMYAGSGVDRGMREGDTAQGAIGHAMAQVGREGGGSAYNAGIAVEKAKFWESRSVPIRVYGDLLAEFADRYWSSAPAGSPLLPDVARGRSLSVFPDSPVVLAELEPELLGDDWRLGADLLENAEIRVVGDSELEIEVAFSFMVDSGRTQTWSARQKLDGSVSPIDEDHTVRRGHSGEMSLADLLEAHPLTIYFADGQSVRGGTVYSRTGVNRSLARISQQSIPWVNTNIQKETAAAALRAGAGVSVQQAVRDHLLEKASRFQHRWLLHNDGGGELADLVLLELDLGGEVQGQFWHVKPSGKPKPSVRVTDLEVVVAQAIKSRRWFADPGVWREMEGRLNGTKSPPLRVIDGDEELLGSLLLPPTDAQPWTLMGSAAALRGDIVIAQPGLAWGKFETKLQAHDLSATQVRDLLSVFNDAVGNLATTRVVCSD